MPLILQDTVITQLMDSLDRMAQESQRIYALLAAAVPEGRGQRRPHSSPRRAPNALPQLTLDVFRLRGLELSVDDVFHAVRASMPEVTPARLRVCLSDLKKAGHLRSAGRGRYTLVTPLPYLSVVGT